MEVLGRVAAAMLVPPWGVTRGVGRAPAAALASIAAAVSLHGAAPAVAQIDRDPPPAVWGALSPGRFAVGLEVLRFTDPSRPYAPLPGPDGRLDVGEWRGAEGRPIQVVVWYPATGVAGSARIRYGDLVALTASELGAEYATPAALSTASEQLRPGPLGPYVGGETVTDEELRAALAVPLEAVRDAPRVPGRFPLVLMVNYVGQGVLAEYLASHGYVVAAIPLLGSSPAWQGRGEDGPAMWGPMADDLAFVHGRLSGHPGVDRERLGIVGMMWSAGVLYAMRTNRVDAIAALDGPGPEPLRAFPEYHPASLWAAVLDLRRTEGRREVALLDSLRYAPRHTVRIDNLPHHLFFDFKRVVQPDSAAFVHAEYDAIAFYTRRHLDRYLRGDESAETDLAAGSIPDALGVTGQIEFTPGTPPPPREADLLSWMRHGRADHALCRVQETLAREPGARPVDPGAAFTVAYFLQRTGDWAQVADAARVVLLTDPDHAQAQRLLETALRNLEPRDGSR